ncbi:hypothetical protein ACFLYO_07555 [Chloroflexota bacterium]
MDFQYIFKQAHQDRLEDAGVKRYGRQINEGYVVEAQPQQVQRKGIMQQVKRVQVAAIQMLLKQ